MKATCCTTTEPGRLPAHASGRLRDLVAGFALAPLRLHRYRNLRTRLYGRAAAQLGAGQKGNAADE